MLKGFGNFGGLLRQVQEASGRLQQMNEQLKTKRAVGSAGGGMVEVEVNGLNEVLRISIDPVLVERQDREMIEDLTCAAVNAAMAKTKEMYAETMQSMTEGLDVPGLGDALAQFTGGDAPDTDSDKT